MTLREELQEFLGNSKDKRIVLVGIGNPTRNDDVVGLKVLEFLKNKVSNRVLLLNTETVPENYTSVIRDFKPTHVLLLDAANFDGKPGEGRIIPLKSIANSSTSTHSLPLNIFIGYIESSICARVLLLGIKGANIEFGEVLTPEVEMGAMKIADLIISTLNE